MMYFAITMFFVSFVAMLIVIQSQSPPQDTVFAIIVLAITALMLIVLANNIYYEYQQKKLIRIKYINDNMKSKIDLNLELKEAKDNEAKQYQKWRDEKTKVKLIIATIEAEKEAQEVKAKNTKKTVLK